MFLHIPSSSRSFSEYFEWLDFYFFTSFWCSQNFPACRAFNFPHLSVIQIRGEWAVVVVGCGPRFLVSEETWAVIPFCQRKQKLCFPRWTAKWLSWENLLIRSVTCSISLPWNYSQGEELPLPIFIHIIQAWGRGLERLNLGSALAAKTLQSTKEKINSFLLSENSKLFINKEKKVQDLSPSCLVCVRMQRVPVLLLTLLSKGHFV